MDDVRTCNRDNSGHDRLKMDQELSYFYTDNLLRDQFVSSEFWTKCTVDKVLLTLFFCDKNFFDDKTNYIRTRDVG